MTAYSTEIIHVGAGIMGGFDKNFTKALQEALDKGSKEGKKLHSVQYIEAKSSRHITYLVIWESNAPTTTARATKSAATKSAATVKKATTTKSTSTAKSKRK